MAAGAGSGKVVEDGPVPVPVEAAVAVGKAPAGPQVYLVQQRFVEAEQVCWMDLASVTVPPRSKRSTVIRVAIEQSGEAVESGMVVRVLDAASAVEVPVGTRQPPAELVIG